MLTSWWIPWSIGLKDGLNPGTLMMCAGLILAYLWMEGRGLAYKKYFTLWFMATCGFNIVFNLGAFAGILLSSVFQNAVLIVHYVLALVAMIAGIVFFYDWMLWAKGKDPAGLLSVRIFKKEAPQDFKWLGFVAIALGLAMSLLGSIWPCDLFITVMGSNLYVTGRTWATIALLLTYSCAQLWLPIVLAILLFGGRLTPRLRQVISAAVFFAASASIFYSR